MRSRCVLLFLTLVFPAVALPTNRCCAQVAEQRSVVSIEEKIKAALDTTIDWEYMGDPLEDVARDLEKRTGVTFLIDKRALQDAGVGSDTQVEFHAKSLTLRAGLRLALEQLDLTWSIADEAVTITTTDAAESRLELRVYNVPAPQDGNPPYDFNELIEIIEATMQPDTWDNSGGPASIETFAGTFVVTQTRSVHEQIAGLLQTLGELNSKKSDAISVDIDARSRSIRPVLDQRVSLTAAEIPLSDFVKVLSNTVHLNVFVDRIALAEAGVAMDSQVSVAATDIPLKTLLSRTLQPLELTWTLRHGELSITSVDSAAATNLLRIYRLDGLGIEQSHSGARFDKDGLPIPGSRGLEELVDVIQTTVAPEDWAQVGGTGDCETMPQHGLLVVSQMVTVHDQIESLFKQLRRAQAEQNATNASAIVKPGENSPEGNSVTARVDAQARPAQLQFIVHQVPLGRNNEPIYAAEDLKRVIMLAIESDSWSNKKGVLIEAMGNGIAIRHYEPVQERISKLLQHIAGTGGQLAPPPAIQNPGGFGGGGGFF